jgi:TM2 domain-containing membrane protein YozV
MFSKPRSRKIATALAFAGAIAPVAGLHKFYLRQPFWGALYVLLSWTPIPRVASALEAVWYLSQDAAEFDQKFNGGLSATPKTFAKESLDPSNVGAITDAVRQLDQLRADGLISEYEFEQKRRQLLDRIG